jgi:HD-GYP domain-containing protein (c-di-GMP phosphodiesterase class II)/DNA-binding CsgD family transcriptional regulator
MAAADCEVSSRLARRLRMSESVVDALGHAFERWDGKGLPGIVAGGAIPLAARITGLTHTIATGMQRGQPIDVRRMVRRRSGTDFDPAIADAFLQQAGDLLAEVSQATVWDVALGAEPVPQPWLPIGRIDEIVEAFADFADLQSPYTLGHSHAVARLASACAAGLGMSPEDVACQRRAGLLHHLGRVSVATGVWCKPGPLNHSEWERVRLYTYNTERIVGSAAALQGIAPLAGAVQERLDGSGYHRGLPAAVIATPSRVLAAADVYQSMTEQRPHRPALSGDDAARAMNAEVTAGRLDREVVAAVLEAKGYHGTAVRISWPVGLTDREIEVLRLMAQARPNKEIATRLFISEETVKNHVKHIYEKIGLATRAGAALFAIENDLLRV